MKELQQKVERFSDENSLEGTTAFRILDLVSEIGEMAKDATESTDYGLTEENLDVKEDEIGDVLFSVCMVANDLDIDLEKALESSLEKYQDRIEEKGDPGSGE